MLHTMANLGVRHYTFAETSTGADVAIDWNVGEKKNSNELKLFVRHMALLKQFVASDSPADARMLVLEDDIKEAEQPLMVQQRVQDVMGGLATGLLKWDYLTLGRCWDYCTVCRFAR